MLPFANQVAIALASQCVEKQDWEAATRHMQRALAVDQSIVQSSFSEAVVVSVFPS